MIAPLGGERVTTMSAPPCVKSDCTDDLVMDEVTLSPLGEAPPQESKSWAGKATLAVALAASALTGCASFQAPAPAPITQPVNPTEPATPAEPLTYCHDFATRDAWTPAPRPDPGEWVNMTHYEVAVVGAGMSGLNTAWRLQEEGHQVAVFERTRHVGGRVRSKQVDNESSLELGAMRYIPSRHHRVRVLVEDVLELPTREFVVGGDYNLQYFRGKRLTAKEITEDPGARPFNLTENEKGKSVDELLSMAISAVVPNFQHLSEEDWDQVQARGTLPMADPSTGEVTEVPLSQLGLRNILARTLSHEAQTMITESIGYNSFLANWDGGQALRELAADFRESTGYRTVVDGMEALPRGLAGKFTEAGGEINFMHTVRAVHHDPEHGFLLEMSTPGGVRHVVADKVVLAIPKVPLQEVLRYSPDLNSPELAQQVDKVTENPMTKIFATYDTPWWNGLGIESGRSLTDLPLGQVYYFGGEGDGQPFVMAYSDGADSEFWEGLQNPGDEGVAKRLCATPQLISEFHRQMEEMHGKDLPEPTGFLYKRWASEYIGGAYHSWKPGSRPWEASEAMVQPIGDLPLYVNGEAYSTQQGWIEGALETSERVLQEIRDDAEHADPGGG